MQQNPYAAPSVDPNTSAGRGANSGPEDWTIGSALSAGWEAFKANALMLILGLILLAVCLYGVMAATMFSVIPMEMFTPGYQPDPNDLADMMANMGTMIGLMVLVILPLEAFLFTGWFRLCLAALRGEDVSLGLLFSGAKRLLPVLLAMIATNIIAGIGFVLLIVPGIIASLGLAFVMPLLADSEMTVGEALSESWESMKGHKMKLFGFGIVAAILWVVVGLVTFNLGALVMGPLLTLAFCEIYVCVTGRRVQQD